jgi:eukaryotic-like serine/threonine-protein kinase
MVDMGEASVVQEPDLVSGRYRLLEVLGVGGMGRVWLADDELLDRRVAVKEITTPTDITTTQMLDLQLRTMREARAAAKLDHPSVVTVFDVVWLPGHSWIVMEYFNSRSLHDAVRADGPMPHPEAARIGLQVLGALRAVHAVGVLHRDVKPHNVLLAADGRVVLTDFGLATFEGAEHGSDPLMGSPHFIAPERLQPGESGEAADLWSLGATLYAAVEGRPPFARRTTEASLAAVLTEPPDPTQHPGLLTPIIKALLTKDPARRLSAEEAEARLRRAVDQRAVGVVPRRRGTGSRARGRVAMPAATSVWATVAALPEPRPRPSRRTVAGLVGSAVLLAGAVGSAVLLNTGHGRAASTPAAMVATPSSAPTPSAATPSAATSSAATSSALVPSPVAGITPVSLCGFSAPAGGPVGVGRTPPEPLPSGFVWHGDTLGFALALPAGWTRSKAGATTCFRDPAGGRALTVNSAAPVTPNPLRYLQAAEKAALTTVPGYAKVSMGVLLLKDGGADWEYTWQPATGPRLHARRVLLAVGPDRAFLLQWTTSDQDWTLNVPTQQRIVSSLRETVAP